MPLSEALVAAFHRDGVICGVEAVPPAVAASNRAAFDERERRDGPQPHYLALHEEERWAWGLVTSPTIVGAARQLLGTDDVFMLATHAFVKPPHSGGFVGWHQDLMFWGLEEGAETVSAWVAIDDSMPDNGCMRAVKASHVVPRLPHGRVLTTEAGEENLLSIGQNIELTPQQEAQVVDLALRPGQASFHHGWAVHGSNANHSNRRRSGVTCIFAPATLARWVGDGGEADRSMKSATSAVKAAAEPWSEGYLVSGSAEGSRLKVLPPPSFGAAPRL
jgi:ectoine hydroxylase-related dioxygenase (phytanoyl-CoA dioxygenase family)